jgi:Na+/phosphate symporter
MNIIDKFLDCFPNICFEITKSRKSESLSIESVNSAEREIMRMLHEAERTLSKVKKLHRKGRASSEEVLDHEFAVFELQQELEKFRESNEDLDNLQELSDE